MPNCTVNLIVSPFGASYRNEEYGAIAIMQDAAADRTCIALSPLNAARAALYMSRCTFVAAVPKPMHTLPGIQVPNI